MDKLARIVSVLHGAGFEPMPEELADALWLARRRAILEDMFGSLPSRSDRREPTRPEPPANQPPAELPKSGPPPRPRPEPEGAVHPYTRPRPGPAVPTEGARATPFRVPAVPMLPEALRLDRALRPLKRRVPSRVQVTLDEDATVQRIAEQALWLPVFRPSPERWLELALVVDGYSSMVIWEPLLADLRRLFERSGACRDVRVWRLVADSSRGETRLRLADESGRCARHVRELVEGTGRRLIWVLSDCVAPYWRDNAALFDLLRLWSRSNPLTLVQMLPQRFWPRSGLSGMMPINLRAGMPGALNARLRGDESCPPASLKLPVVTLDPESVAFWASLLAGRGNVWSAGVALTRRASVPPDGPARNGVAPMAAPSGLERLERFTAMASPEAQRLAAWFATVPLTLPIMRLAQQVLLPQTRLVHLAEVFLSGLLGRADRDLEEQDRENDPLKIPFDFLPDIRELLLDSLPVSEVEWAARRMAVAIEQRLGQAADFLALLVDPTTPSKLPLQKRSLPFAKIRLKVLHRLGGSYSGQATELAEVIERVERGVASSAFATHESPYSSEPTPFRDRFPDGAIGPAMIWLPGGAFAMGDDKSWEKDDKPAHSVTLSHFGIGQYPVTFEEYDRFCEATRQGKPADQGWGRGRRPAINVSWDDAQAYCRWLSQQTGQDYRLLTEAQWEYACRAGSDATYCFGDDEKPLSDYAWYRRNSGGQTYPVGEKQANVWGLHDLHGNVWEWVWDWYGPYSKEPQHNPSGPETGSARVFRGGSRNDVAEICGSASRLKSVPRLRSIDLGFRLARLGPVSSYPFTRPPEPEPPKELLLPELEPPPELPTEPVPGLRDLLADGSPGPAMVWLPGGTFRMGQDDSPYQNEKPAHEVEVSGFSIGQCPVTFEGYRRFCEAMGRKQPEDERWGRGVRPVINVSWEDATAYCKWLSEQTGARYRLPTEAEWEYACRAGSTTRYCFGDDERRLGEYAWYSKNAGGKTHSVREKLPNSWHLYELHGNVWEWVQDRYASDYYRRSPRENPTGPEMGSFRLFRGGSSGDGAGNCRSAFRSWRSPGIRYSRLGFRLARDGAWPSNALTLARQRAAKQSVWVESEVERKPAYRAYEGFQDSLKDGSTAPEMVYLRGGTFQMGDVRGKVFKNERPVHEVTLDAFAIGRYSVTVEEFRRFVDATGYRTEAEREGGAQVYEGKEWGQKADAHWRNPYFTQEDAHPVVCISWNDAEAYCKWLSEQTGEQYSLPTEAEWEYACRASSGTAYCFGDDEQQLGDYAWYSKNAGGKTHPVGQKRANRWGLYDMHGNVWEWVRDWYGDYPEGSRSSAWSRVRKLFGASSKQPQRNPSGPETSSFQVFRGGSWDDRARYCWSAYRSGNDPGFRVADLGFRLARRV